MDAAPLPRVSYGGSVIAARGHVADYRALAIVHLAFFAGRGRADHAGLDGLHPTERHHKPPDAMPRAETMDIDEVLIDGVVVVQVSWPRS